MGSCAVKAIEWQYILEHAKLKYSINLMRLFVFSLAGLNLFLNLVIKSVFAQSLLVAAALIYLESRPK